MADAATNDVLGSSLAVSARSPSSARPTTAPRVSPNRPVACGRTSRMTSARRSAYPYDREALRTHGRRCEVVSKKKPRAPAPPPLPTLEELTASAAPLGEDERAEQEEDEAGPGVVLATVADLPGRLPAALIEAHGSRPIWFFAAADERDVGVFERLPEGAFDKGATAAILAALRALSLEESDRLQAFLGQTERIVYGFHADASLDDVAESFEDDGFDVLEAIVDGHVAVDDEA